MAKKFLTPIDLGKLELLNPAFQVLGTPPTSPVKGQFYFDDSGKVLTYWDGTAWVAAKSGTGGPPTGAAGGDLTGTYPNPTIGTGKVTSAHILDGTITDTDVAAANKDGANATPSLRTLGLGAQQALPGNTPVNGLVQPNGALGMNSKRILFLGDPVDPTDAANKQYVDSVAQGLDAKQSVKAASTGNLNLAAQLTTIDGQSITVGDRFLAKNQTVPAENGLYYIPVGGYPIRSTDGDTWNELVSAYVWVEQGTVNKDTGWVCTVDVGGTLNTTAVTWAMFAAAGGGLTQAQADTRYVNSDGDMSMTGSYQIDGSGTFGVPSGLVLGNQLFAFTGIDTQGTLSVSLPASRVDFSASTAPLKLPTASPAAAYDAVPLSYFNTMSVHRFSSQNVGGATSQVVNHNLNTRLCNVTVHRNASPFDEVECDVEHTDLNNVTLRFAVAPAANEYSVMVVG